MKSGFGFYRTENGLLRRKKGYEIMWTVVYITQSFETADKIKELLEKAEILVMLRRVEENSDSYEILVPDTEIEEAHNIILNFE